MCGPTSLLVLKQISCDPCLWIGAYPELTYDRSHLIHMHKLIYTIHKRLIVSFDRLDPAAGDLYRER